MFFGSACQPVVITPLAAAKINEPPNAVRSLGGSSFELQTRAYCVLHRYHSILFHFCQISPSTARGFLLLPKELKPGINRLFRVDHYPDDTWHLSGADLEHTYASHLPLDDETADKLRSFVSAYSSVTFQTSDGIGLRLYGLGERVELSEDDRSKLTMLAVELAASVW